MCDLVNLDMAKRSGRVNRVAGRVDQYISHEFFYLLRKQHVFVIWKVMQQII